MSAIDFDTFALERFRGDTIVLTATVTRNSVAVDITGALMWCTAKTSLSLPDNQATFQKSVGSGIVLTTPASGIATITIAPGDIDDFTETTILYVDIQLKESNGQITTIAAGTLKITPDVTITTT